MRAAVFEQAGSKLKVQDVPDPTPGPGQLVMKVKYCGVCGSDLHMTDAHAPRNPTAGSILGHEFCGEVVAVGPGVEGDWKTGDKITALPFIGCGGCAACLAGQPVWCSQGKSHAGGVVPGGFAEYVAVGARETLRLPQSLSWEESALVEPLAVGLHGVELAKLKPGANILVVGAGPVGLAVVACARALGAGRIVVTAKSDRRADLARAMGASDFVTTEEKVGSAFRKLVGGPPDVIFECVGSPGMIDYCIGLAAPRSTIVVLGVCMQQDTMRPMLGIVKELNLQFSLAYGVRDFDVAADMLLRSRVDLTGMVTDIVDFDAFPDAFEALRHRSHQCKVLLAPA
ncbi:MAG: alcohol dehydrogenase catalytic domain-containing protein [Phenylobacterium sp.]|uniref:alcohol dehydrogenase catalytic domain-containing protein n=1 Tax=Phenylobacterium sp. TaxID=1871053 RepID=UPI002735856C|nr:alcohol dehydrogenase catalytic domain-containing protein [Phenylobacterium sp.]MDP3175446.1 alcohol dehydrogenase catalytic domain-containing protein [Phenylobacterium sp.]